MLSTKVSRLTQQFQLLNIIFIYFFVCNLKSFLLCFGRGCNYNFDYFFFIVDTKIGKTIIVNFVKFGLCVYMSYTKWQYLRRES